LRLLAAPKLVHVPHLLSLGDEAGPEPALFALHGVDLTLQAVMRPTGWEDELDFGAVTMRGCARR
jgi:hypothetical protein